jgi:dTDP-4-dehydrorhamnose reductase
MRRVLVTGAAGMLGSELLLQTPRDCVAVGTDLMEADVRAPGVDLAEPAAVARLFREHGPFDGVLHCAAWTAVDLAEQREADALRANGEACRVLARAAAQAAIPLVLVSTDFVFDGRATRPYREDDPVAPLSAYGRTKLAGERAALAEHPRGTRIVRTQWLYGPRGKHFPGTIHGLAKTRPELKVVDDQVGSPTTTLELAPALWDVLARGEAGVYHAACEGSCSWYELARATLELTGLGHVKLSPCTTAEFPRPAARPAYSVLDCSKLARLRGQTLLPWRAALARFLERHPL